VIYEDLDLRIQADGDKFRVVAQLGTQFADAPFALTRSPFWDLEKLELGGPDEIRRLGAALFDALIRKDVRSLYEQGRGGSGSDAGKGLRIRILIDSREARLRPFMQVPWEILYDSRADASQLLALDPRRAIVRVIDSNEPHVEPQAGPLKRVLLVSANPIDTHPLKLGEEISRAEATLVRHHLRPEVLCRATRSALHDQIRDYEPQIVHFMGHGSFNSIRREGVLLLEDKNHGRDALYASTFATFFTGRATPRLVILNSCLTAVAGSSRTFKAFSSVAAALIAAGLPAVIAMQSTIRDTSAIRFTERLYAALTRDIAIESALSEARVALSAVDRYMLDWAAPVLYVRAHGGGAVGMTQPQVSPKTQPTENREALPPSVYVERVGIQVIGHPTGPITNHESPKK
jgi:CHAT domain